MLGIAALYVLDIFSTVLQVRVFQTPDFDAIKENKDCDSATDLILGGAGVCTTADFTFVRRRAGFPYGSL